MLMVVVITLCVLSRGMQLNHLQCEKQLSSEITKTQSELKYCYATCIIIQVASIQAAKSSQCIVYLSNSCGVVMVDYHLRVCVGAL